MLKNNEQYWKAQAYLDHCLKCSKYFLCWHDENVWDSERVKGICTNPKMIEAMKFVSDKVKTHLES